MEFPEGWRAAKHKTLCIRGVDIFWNNKLVDQSVEMCGSLNPPMRSVVHVRVTWVTLIMVDYPGTIFFRLGATGTCRWKECKTWHLLFNT